jgi:NADPH:quinone reductase-like Zn-dependent oxidoreductase
MKAIVCRRYGVVQLEEVERPVPGDDEVLIRVRAASVNPFDRGFKGVPYVIRLMSGLRKPKDPRVGHDVAGQVEAIGRNVTLFKPGDEVFGVCRGAFAEYACASESRLAMKPPNVTFEQAAAVPIAALTALQGLRDKGEIQPAHDVLINGASGGVGTFAVQIAKSFGANVTAVCSTRNVEMVRSIGADRVIDYTQQDFTTSGKLYDQIFDCVGNRPLSTLRRLLKPNGKHLAVGAKKLTRLLRTLVVSLFVRKKLVLFVAKVTSEDLNKLRDLIAAGKITPLIDRTYKLSDAQQALEHMDAGHARGKIVITI